MIFATILLLIVLLAVGSVGLWLLVCFIVSHLGGWSSLAQRYRREEPFTGQMWHGCSGYFKPLGSYRRVLTLGADSGGLYIATLALFRLAHPPLYVPWSDVSTEPSRSLVSSVVELHFARVPGVSLKIDPGLASRLANASSGGLVLPSASGGRSEPLER